MVGLGLCDWWKLYKVDASIEVHIHENDSVQMFVLQNKNTWKIQKVKSRLVINIEFLACSLD